MVMIKLNFQICSLKRSDLTLFPLGQYIIVTQHIGNMVKHIFVSVERQVIRGDLLLSRTFNFLSFLNISLGKFANLCKRTSLQNYEFLNTYMLLQLLNNPQLALAMLVIACVCTSMSRQCSLYVRLRDYYTDPPPQFIRTSSVPKVSLKCSAVAGLELGCWVGDSQPSTYQSTLYSTMG